MRIKIIFSLIVVITLSLPACGHQNSSSCSGKIYNSPSIYVVGSYVYLSLYSKNKSSNPNDPSCPTNTSSYDLIFMKSTDGGNNWTSGVVKQNISPSSEPVQLYPQTIAADPTNTNRIYISYLDTSNNLYCALSSDGGNTWSSSRVENTANVTVLGHAIITGLNGAVYVAYTAVVGGLTNLRFSSSTDNGVTWNSPVTVDANNGAGYYPSMAIDSANYLYVSYYYAQTTGGLMFAKSTSSGAGWSTTPVKTNDGTVSGPFSSIAVTTNGIYIAFYNPRGYTVIAGGYTENKDGTVQLISSIDTGVSFSNLVTIDSNTYTGRATAIAASGSSVYVAYGLYKDEGAATDNRLKFASSSNGGLNFTVRSAELTTGLAVTNNKSGLNYLSPAMVFYSPNGIGKLYLVYAGDSGANIVFKTSTDGGTNWGSVSLTP